MTNLSSTSFALEKGVAFLESAQLPSGEIPIEIADTFAMTSGRSRQPCVFPTAVAARVLPITPSAKRVHSRALDFLEREMSAEGLWRHPSRELREYLDTPLDLDDTAIASTALKAAGRSIPNNRDLLLDCRERNGLFRTWIPQWGRHPFRTFRFFFVRHTGEVHDVDSVVNANVVLYLGDREETRPAIEHMLAVLRDHREMQSTVWYGSPFIVWYFFSHALREIAPEAGELIVPRVKAAMPANALEHALASSTLLLWNHVPDVQPLLDAQLPSGGWPRAGFYHMGRRRDEPQPKAPWWGSESLTTVFAVEALTRRMLMEERTIEAIRRPT